MNNKPYEDDIMEPFNRLYNSKKEKIKMFYIELMDIPELKNLNINTLFEEQAQTKFQHHSMCLTLPQIRILYSFFRQNKHKFNPKSKQSVHVLTEDIDYIDKETRILDADSANSSLTPEEKPKYHTAYFPFYKNIDKSTKIDNLNKTMILKDL